MKPFVPVKTNKKYTYPIELILPVETIGILDELAVEVGTSRDDILNQCIAYIWENLIEGQELDCKKEKNP